MESKKKLLKTPIELLSGDTIALKKGNSKYKALKSSILKRNREYS